MMSLLIVAALSLNFSCSPTSPITQAADDTSLISSSSLLVARMMLPSKMSVMLQIFSKVSPCTHTIAFNVNTLCSNAIRQKD